MTAPFYHQILAGQLVPIRLGTITAAGVDYGAGPVGPGGPARLRLHAAAAHATLPSPDQPARLRLHHAAAVAVQYVPPRTPARARLHNATATAVSYTPPHVPARAKLHQAGPVEATPA